MERNLKQIPNLLSRHFFPPLHLSLQSNTVVSYGFTPLHSYTAYGSFQLKTLFWCFRTFHASRSSFCYLHRHQALAVTHLELMLQTGIATVRAKHAILGKGALQVKEPGKELFNQSLLLVQHTESWDGHLLVKWIAFFFANGRWPLLVQIQCSGIIVLLKEAKRFSSIFSKLSWAQAGIHNQELSPPMGASPRMLWLQSYCLCATSALLSSAADLCNVMEEGNHAAQYDYAYIPGLKCLVWLQPS